MSEPAPPRLLAVEQRTVGRVAGPLLVVERVRGAAYDEVVEVTAQDGIPRRGRVLEVDGDRAVVQVLEGTAGLDVQGTSVRFTGEPLRMGVGPSLFGRTLDGGGRPIDGGPPPTAEAFADVNGRPLNPAARDRPHECIETGISAIDGLNTLVWGQKLPIFSAFGLPGNELAARIAAHARALGPGGDKDGDAKPEELLVVFAAIGITAREAEFFRRRFEETGAIERTALFLNRAGDPAIERLLTPRAALAAAEHMAFERGRRVLVILTDMTSYCEALREVASARDELPARRGYPGAMYTDLASLYERAGRVRGRPGSLTQLVIVSMPDDDITHPIPDLTGYITEGQIVLSRELFRRGIDPPIDVLPSLSRLMAGAIGEGKTRADHRELSSQLYALYARGRDLRRLAAIVGEDALSKEDRRDLAFAEGFEGAFLHQEGGRARTLTETLDAGWALLTPYAEADLPRITPETLRRVRATPTR